MVYTKTREEVVLAAKQAYQAHSALLQKKYGYNKNQQRVIATWNAEARPMHQRAAGALVTRGLMTLKKGLYRLTDAGHEVYEHLHGLKLWIDAALASATNVGICPPAAKPQQTAQFFTVLNKGIDETVDFVDYETLVGRYPAQRATLADMKHGQYLELDKVAVSCWVGNDVVQALHKQARSRQNITEQVDACLRAVRAELLTNIEG